MVPSVHTTNSSPQGVHLPRLPRRCVSVHRNEPSLDSIGISTRFIALVPFKIAGELLLGNDPCSETQVDRMRLEVEDGAVHSTSVTM